MMRSDVAVIGAGLAGLYACYQLQKAGISFVLLDARDRVGGRILSVDAAGSSTDRGFDLGPSWYWPSMQPAISKLVEELALASFDQHSEGDAVFEHALKQPLHRHSNGAEEAHWMRLAGGTGALVRAVSRNLPPNRVLLNARVTDMMLGADAVEITFVGSDGSVGGLSTLHVIAALPPRLLEANISFTPALDAATARRWRSTPTWMAPHAKFFALYDRPFWRTAGFSGTAQSMVGPMQEMHDATTASGEAALFGFIGIPAEQRARLSEDALVGMSLDQFARIFGEEARAPYATLLKDWAADPFTATAADRGRSGHIVPSNEPWVTGAWRERLELGGSEVSHVEPGYLNGAVEAAERAVAATLRRCQKV